MEMFFVLYFFMTGLHAIHLIIGIVLGRRDGLAVVARLVFGRRGDADRGDRVVLALHRHRLGVPLSLALSDRRPQMKQHISSIQTNVTVFVVLNGPVVRDRRGGLSAARGLCISPLAMAIATAKAVLIVVYFMHVKYSHRLTAVICGGIVTLAAES